MVENPNEAGAALLIPSYTLRSGLFVHAKRWGTPDELCPEDPAELAALQRKYRNQRIHVGLAAEEKWSETNIAAIEALKTHEMIVLAEGDLSSQRTVKEVVAAGADILVLEAGFVADEHRFLHKIRVGILTVVDSPRESPTIIDDLGPVLDGSFEGLVTAETTDTGDDVEEMLKLVNMLNLPQKPLVLGRLRIENAGKGVALLEALAPLNVSKIVDGEFVINLVRLGRSELIHEHFH